MHLSWFKDNSNKSERVNWLWFAVFLLIVGLSSCLLMAFIADYIKNRAEKELLVFAEVVNAGIDPLKIKELSGTISDYQNPEYQKLSNKFVRIGDINDKVRYIYIIGQKNNNLFFYLDSQPTRFNDLEGAEPLAQPGESYTDVLGNFSLTLEKNQKVISEPYSDRWGSFISVSVPIFDSVSNQVVALLGIDMETGSLTNQIRLNQLIIFLIALLVLIFIFLLFLYRQSQLTARQKLRLEQIKTKEYLDLAPILIMSLDTKGNILMINRAGCEILEGAPQKIIGRNWFSSFIPPSSIKKAKNTFDALKRNNALNPGQAELTEGEILTFAKKKKAILWNNNVIRDNAGQVIEIISSGQDITNKIKIEEELTKRNQELEKLNKLMIDREMMMIEMKRRIENK